MSINRWMGKQTVVYPCNRIQLNNRKECIIDPCNTVDKVQNNYAIRNNPGRNNNNNSNNSTYCPIPIIWNSRKSKLICSDRKQVSGYLGMEGERWEWITKKNKEIWGVMSKSISLTVVMVSWWLPMANSSKLTF